MDRTLTTAPRLTSQNGPFDADIAGALAASHYNPATTATLLRAHAWWSSWRQHARVAPSDISLIPTFFRTLVAAGATKADLGAVATVLGFVFRTIPGFAAITPGKWSASVPLRPLSLAEIAALSGQCVHPGSRVVLGLLFGAGISEKHARSLSRQQIDWKGQRLVVQRPEGARWCPLPACVGPPLARALASPGDALVADRNGAPLLATAFRADLASAAAKLGLAHRVTPGGVRRSFGAHHLRAGKDFRSLLARLELPDSSGRVPRLPGPAELATAPANSQVSPPHISFPFVSGPPR